MLRAVLDAPVGGSCVKFQCSDVGVVPVLQTMPGHLHVARWLQHCCKFVHILFGSDQNARQYCLRMIAQWTHFVAHANNVVSYTLERFRLCPSVHTGRSSMQCVVRASPIQHHRHRPLGGPDPCCSAFPHHPSLHDSRPATILIHAQQCDGANQCRCPGASRGCLLYTSPSPRD